jgi:drug/metabolite transporter superfamily protein YnfA
VTARSIALFIAAAIAEIGGAYSSGSACANTGPRGSSCSAG